jgi:RsiW-degrading membrane proteinase PrsW (M82 family)
MFGSVSRSTIFPLAGNRSGLVTKSHLVPIVLTIMVGLALGASNQVHLVEVFTATNLQDRLQRAFQIRDITALGVSTGDLQGVASLLNAALQICWILGAYVTVMVNYFVYMLCGRENRWWLVAGTFAVMAVLVMGPLSWIVAFYNEHTLGDPETASAAWRIVGAFIGPGIGEEIAKALPVLVLALVAVRGSGPLSRSIGVTEPLDGILVGVASGAAFAIIETVALYVPRAMLGDMLGHINSSVGVLGQQASADQVKQAVATGLLTGTLNARFDAVVVILMRGLPELAGHLAYSGIFGYFIGLAVLKRSSAPRILAVGLLSAAALHGSWDAVAFSSGSLNPQAAHVLLLLIAILSYAFLASCILKARKISPTRAQNFASVYVPTPPVPPAPLSPVAPMQPRAQPANPPPRVAPAATPSPAARPAPAASPAAVALAIRIGPAALKLVPGLSIEPIHLGSAGAGRGKSPIAEVAANPNDRRILGLRNLSDRTYRVTLTGGQTIDLPKGKSVRLAPGLVIDFGGIAGLVETV